MQRVTKSIATVSVVLLVSAASGYWIIARRNAFIAQRPRGLIQVREDWPRYLRTTVETLQADGFVPNTIDVFRLREWSDCRIGLRFLLAETQIDELISAMSLTKLHFRRLAV